MVLYRSLKRFELYNYLNLETDTFSSEELRKYNSFLANEYKMFTPDKDGIMRPKQSYKKIFETFRECMPQKKRGDHYISSVEIMLRAFFSWCIKRTCLLSPTWESKRISSFFSVISDAVSATYWEWPVRILKLTGTEHLSSICHRKQENKARKWWKSI